VNKRGKIVKCQGLSLAFAMAIPKGRSSEERIAGKKTRSVEVVTASGEYQNPENCHARYPSGRHHCHAALPHVILCQHRQKTIILSHSYIKRFIDMVHVYVYIYIYIYISIDQYRCLFAHIPHFVAFHVSYIMCRLLKRLPQFFLSEISEEHCWG